MIDVKILVPIIKELLTIVITEAKSGRLRLNIGTDGIFVLYYSSNTTQPIRIEIPFPQYSLKSSQA